MRHNLSLDKDFIHDLIEEANGLTNGCFDADGLTIFGGSNLSDTVLDSPIKYYLPGKTRVHDAVLFVSRERFPNFVGRAVKNARQARALMSNKNSAVILEPTADGRFRGLSYAIWPRHNPISNFRIVRLVQKQRLSSQVFEWLCGVAADTSKKALNAAIRERNISNPLKCVAENRMQCSRLRARASDALRRFENGEWSAVTTLQHSDFWLGNILLPNRRTTSSSNLFGFYVIDWGGAYLDGSPSFDLLQYCISTGFSTRRARGELLKYAASVQVLPEELFDYSLIALGRVGLNLEQFPEDRYIELCRRTADYLERAGF